MSKRVYLIVFVTCLFRLQGYSQCYGTYQSPMYVVMGPTVSAPESIIYCNHPGDYSIITGIIAGTTYVVTNINYDTGANGYITVTSLGPVGTLVGHGVSPFTFTAAVSGNHYIHVFANASCSTEGRCFTTTITREAEVPIFACGTTFYDSGGRTGHYGINETKTTILAPDNLGESVTATFTSFNLEDGFDFLKVYDGPNTTFPAFPGSPYTGTTIPGPFTATHASGALTFVFTSDGSGNKSGWAAVITCENSNPCNLTITETQFPIGADPCNLDYTKLTAADGATTGVQAIWSPTSGLYTDNALSIPYTEQLLNKVYAVPSGTQTYTATQQNGCEATATVIHNKKTWNGSQSTNWFAKDNWTPSGVPTITDCVSIPSSASTSNRSPVADVSNIQGPIPLPPSDARAKNIKVLNNGSLEVMPSTFLEIEEWLNVANSGTVMIRDSGSLVQLTDVSTNNNTGNIRIQREVLGVDAQNYVYWSSPVENFSVANINSAASELRFKWEPTTTDIYGNWIATSEDMTVGRGYIVRGLATPPSPIPLNNAEFRGVPNNGIIKTPISRGNWLPAAGNYPGAGNSVATPMDDNWNLVGNPYPSAISYSAFMIENGEGANPKIDGTIYLWSHLGTPTSSTDPFYSDYAYNYLGSDYVAYNGTGPNPPLFNGNIASGQSFFVQMEDGAGMNNTVLFNNGMRSVTQDNDNFLRNGERHRIWLDLINQNNDASSTLVGYVQNATNEKDRIYDGHDLSDTSLQFYSMIGEEEMTIQGRALPFDETDTISLGLLIPENGIYKIAINSVDGLFSDASQNIYLEDTYLNTIHDLRVAPYTFTSESGTFNDRFILRYTNETLSTPDQVANFGFNIIGLKDYIKVTSGNNPISTIKVYDVLGRLLADYKDVNALEFKFELINQSEGALIVKANLYNGQQKIKKVIY